MFAKMNADSDVMKYYPSLLTESESNNFAKLIQVDIERNRWGLWAIEYKKENKFIGFVGIHSPKYKLPCSPCIEVGWRLDKNYWGQGFATEGGHASLNFAFNNLNLKEVVSFTSTLSQKSIKVMERLGMQNTNSNFIHPKLDPNHTFAEHVLYKITKTQFDKIDLNQCPNCNSPFVCDIEKGLKKCWCFNYSTQEIDQSIQKCFCPNCLKIKK